MSLVVAKINLSKIPKDKIFVGEKGKYLDVNVSENREADQYGNTHSLYVYDKEKPEGERRIYIGNGKARVFTENAPKIEQVDDDLPF